MPLLICPYSLLVSFLFLGCSTIFAASVKGEQNRNINADLFPIHEANADGNKHSMASDPTSLPSRQPFVCTWTEANTPSSFWLSISSSDSGQYVTAGQYPGQLYYSHDYGTNWVVSSSSPSTNWHHADMSSSGEFQYVGDWDNGYMYYSHDYGVTWTQATSIADEWGGCTTDSTGVYVIAGVRNGYLYYSSNHGVSYTATTTTGYWLAVASDGSGQNAIAGDYGGSMYMSSDSGQTWQASTSSPSGSWEVATMSASGQFAVGIISGSSIYHSSDFGDTWTQSSNAPSASWIGLASDASGRYLFASIRDDTTGGIYSSDDFGATWSINYAEAKLWRLMSTSGQGDRVYAAGENSKVYVGDCTGTHTPTSQPSSEPTSIPTKESFDCMWIATTSPAKNWRGIDTSAEGQYISVAAADSDVIHYSHDYGATWLASNSISANW